VPPRLGFDRVWVLGLTGCGGEGGCKPGVFGTILSILAVAAVVLLVARLLFTRRGREYLRFMLGFRKRGG
jgi:hypothetical protein